MFSSKSFIVSGLTFWCLIHFEFIFVYGAKSVFFNIIKLINLFMAALGLHCCVWAFCSCGEQGLLFIAVCGLLIVVASLVAEHGL